MPSTLKPGGLLQSWVGIAASVSGSAAAGAFGRSDAEMKAKAPSDADPSSAGALFGCFCAA